MFTTIIANILYLLVIMLVFLLVLIYFRFYVPATRKGQQTAYQPEYSYGCEQCDIRSAALLHWYLVSCLFLPVLLEDMGCCEHKASKGNEKDILSDTSDHEQISSSGRHFETKENFAGEIMEKDEDVTLRKKGFSELQIKQLIRLRQQYKQNHCQSSMLYRRLEFTRWLVLTGKLTDHK